MALYPGTTAGNLNVDLTGWGLGAGDYPPGDITPGLSGFAPGPGLGGSRDPNQVGPIGPIIPWIFLPGGLGGLGGGGGRTLPPLQQPVPPPPSTTGVGGLGGGRPGNPLPSLGGGAPVSSSGIDWSKVLTGLGQSIQGGIQGYQTPPGGQQGGRGGSAGSQQGGRTPETAPPPKMQTQAPIPPQMFPQAMPGGSAIATAPISPLSLPSGSSAPLSPTILNTRPTMPQFMGSFQMGGIVPRTGLYPVQGGEQVVPKKKVQKIAKLHKGEMVLPRFVGSFQQGGTVPLVPQQTPQNASPGMIAVPIEQGGGFVPAPQTSNVIPPLQVSSSHVPFTMRGHSGFGGLPAFSTPDWSSILGLTNPSIYAPRFVGSFQEGGVIPPDPMNLPQGSAAPFPTDISGYPTTAAQQPTREDQAKYAALQLAKLVGQRFAARGLGTAGGGAPEGGSVAFPGHVGTLGGTGNVPPQMNLMAFQQAMTGGGAGAAGAAGAAGGTAGAGLPVPIPPVQQVPQVPGMPMGPMPDVRPGAYGGPALYAQQASLPPYQSQFAPGGRAQYVTQNLLGGLSNALLQWQQQKFDKKAQQSMADAALLANTAGTAPPQAVAGGGSIPPTAATAGQSTFQRQAQALGGAAQPGTNAFQGATAQIGQMQSGQPGVPTQAQTNEPQRAPMTPEQQQAYQTLMKTNPKLATHFSDIIGKQHDRAMKNFAKAQMNPSGPEYRGMMAYYQQMQAQQQQQAETAAKIANANAQLIGAQANQAEVESRAHVLDALSGRQTGPEGGQQAPSGLSLALRSPWGPALQKMAPFTSDEEGVLDTAVTSWAVDGDKTAIPSAASKIYGDREIVRRPHWIPVGNGYQMVRVDPNTGRDVPLSPPQPQLPAGNTMPVLAPSTTPGGGTQPGGAQLGGTAQVVAPSMPGNTASEQSSFIPNPQQIEIAQTARTQQPGITLGPKIFKDVNVYAFNPKAGRNGQWLLTTPKEADAKNYLYPTKEIGPKEMMDDRQLDVRLNDTTKKILRYEDSFKTDLSVKDKTQLALYQGDDELKAALFGTEIPVDWLNRLGRSWVYNSLSREAQHRLFAYGNAKEAMLGYNRVLSGSARNNQVGLQLNIDVLPPPLFNREGAQDAFGQFKENIPTVSQGLPVLPGVDNPEDILSGKISWRTQAPAAGGEAGAGGTGGGSSTGGGTGAGTQTRPRGPVWNPSTKRWE